MKVVRTFLTTLVTLTTCVGCTALDVDMEQTVGSCRGDSSCKTRDLDGFPFNVKVPQRVQTTKIAVPVVVVEVKEGASGAPLLAPMEFRGMKSLDDILEAARGAANDAHDLGDVSAQFATPALKSMRDITIPLTGGRTVSNTITVEAVLSERQYYFSPRMPIAGSASATVKPGPDGTLGEASVEVTDKTLEVLPNLIPIKDMLLSRTMSGMTDKARGSSAPTIVVSLATEIHTLRKILPAGTTTAVPLNLAQVPSGEAELVSVVKVGTEASGPDKPSYSITGKITLPDPPK